MNDRRYCPGATPIWKNAAELPVTPRMQALQGLAGQFEERLVEPNSGLGQAITYSQNH